ncbi:MAG: glycosyl hydrolase 108 family protein [Parabacteroides sp.]|nr:glycosyl hydrolase 108 family protein [Parabacteroides sp.]
MASFETYLKKLLQLEGGYSNDPADRGGLTNHGITQATWQRIGYDKDGDCDVDPDDLLRLTHQDVSKILRHFYWNRWRADEIESQPVAWILVDWLWCSGKWGIIIPQRILGVEPDGYVGKITLHAVNQTCFSSFHKQLINARLRFILDIIARDPTQQRFRNGWIARVNSFK